MFEVGDVLGPLTIHEVLEGDPLLPCFKAVGAQGRVHRVHALGLSSELPAEALTQFGDRVRLAASLEHPAVLKPRHWSVEPPVYVASAQAKGESLASVLDRLGPLPWEATATIGRDVAGALAAAAEVGALHGGLTADAIFVHSGAVMLADWGIAELAAQLSHDHSQLLPSVVDSLAPEHVHSMTTTAASDVFVLGALLYRTLSGTRPFQAPSPLGVTIKLSMATFEPLAADLAPEPLRETIHQAMAADPKERPLAEALVRAFEGCVPRADAREDALRALVVPTPAETRSASPAPDLPVPVARPWEPSTRDSGFGGEAQPSTAGFQGPPDPSSHTAPAFGSPSPVSSAPVGREEGGQTAVAFTPSVDAQVASSGQHPGVGNVGERGAGFDDAATEFAPPPRMPETEAELPVDSTMVLPPRRPAPSRSAPVALTEPSLPSWILWVALAFGALLALGGITALAILFAT